MRAAAALVLASILSIAPPLRAQGSTGAEPFRPAVPNGSDPKSWEPYFDLGVKLMKSQPAKAAEAFYWATRFDPARAEPLFARYAVSFVLAKQEDAIAYFRSEPTILQRPDIMAADSLRSLALMRNPFVHRGLEILIFDRMPGSFSDSRDTRAWIAYSNGEFTKAIDLHTGMINRGGPDALWSRFDRALAYVAANQLPLALADLRALLDALRAQDAKQTVVLYRSKHYLLYMIGMILTQQRNYADARTAFQEALLENAAFAYGNAALAAISRAQRNPTQAASEFALAVELAPNDGVLRQQYGQVLVDLQRYDGAVEQLQRAAALEPYWALPHLYLGRAREKQGNMDEAFAHYERFVALSTANDSQAKAIKLRLDLRKGSGQQ